MVSHFWRWCYLQKNTTRVNFLYQHCSLTKIRLPRALLGKFYLWYKLVKFVDRHTKCVKDRVYSYKSQLWVIVTTFFIIININSTFKDFPWTTTPNCQQLQDLLAMERRFTLYQFLGELLFPIFLHRGNTNEIFQQYAKHNYFEHIL